jgi:hypothetical protein
MTWGSEVQDYAPYTAQEHAGFLRGTMFGVTLGFLIWGIGFALWGVLR